MLWSINITGPDDVLAVSSRHEAVSLATKFNAWSTRFEDQDPDENMPLMWAVPCQWPHDDASHAANLGALGDYAFLRDEAA